MKITGYRLTRVRVPLEPVYVSSQAARPATERVIVRLYTDNGLIGLGETLGAPEILALAARIGDSLIGRDALDRNGLRRRFAKSHFQNRNGRHGLMALAGIDTALWDIAARHYEVPLVDLLGGAGRRRIPCAGLMGAVPLEQGAGPDDVQAFVADLGNVDKVVAHAQGLVERHGFDTLKIKSAGLRRQWDIAVMEAFRETFGPAMRLRQDSNGAWTPAEALALCKPLERLNLEYYEDPTHDIEGLARLRRDVRTPIATNMYVIHHHHLPAAVAMDAIDVALVDIYHWGGIAAFGEAVAATRPFGIEVGLHSNFELGVATAANLHLAAAFPEVCRAIDTVLPSQRGEIIEGPGFRITDGGLDLPDGVGLGVELDEAAIDSLTIENVEAGDIA